VPPFAIAERPMSSPSDAHPPAAPASLRRRLFGLAKLLVACGIFAYLAWKITHQQNIDVLRARLSNLSWGWVGVAVAIQAVAIGFSIVRWGVLLRGQGIRAPWSHLVGAFMAGRFLSAISPGGWTGLDAYRIWDVASRTGKAARSTATVGVDKLLGQAALGSIVALFAVLFGIPYLGATKVAVLSGAFAALVVTIFTLLSRPTLFRAVSARLPAKVRTRLQTMVDAVCAYQGKGRLLAGAFALSWGTHLFTNLISVAAALALGIALRPGEVFFVSTMLVIATLLPISPNGMGVREAAAVYLFGQVGVGPGEAVLVPLLYFAIDMLFSAAGGLFLVLPRRQPAIVVEDPDREERARAEIPVAPPEAWPKLARGLSIGFGAGLLGGALLGLGEAAVVLASSGGAAETSVLAYGGVAYGLMCGAGGAVTGLALAWSGRWMKREAVAEPLAFARLCGLVLAAPAFAITAFRVRRDLFDEQLVWKSAQGLGVTAACALAALVLYLVVATALRRLTRARVGAWLLRPWGTPALVAAALGAVTAASLGPGAAAVAEDGNPRSGNPAVAARPPAPAQAGPVIVLVVDTLRADHLPAYGYEEGHTPNLDAFAREAVRFERAYANASWTRPSFATILTGSYVSRHQTMSKSASLPEALVTLPEALAQAGFVTAGVVTNYNVAPFFRFDQGFDRYRYLEPAFVLGANDTAAKLLFIQFARQQIEKVEERMSGPQPGRAYRDAAEVNRAIAAELDRMPQDRPFFLFAGYMDPHDPYFPHADTPRGNVGGVAFSRAANQTPDPAVAPRLRALYDGEITYWDRHFGALLDDLRRRGLYDRATIIVTSDHGEEFGEHGGFWHGTTLYDEQVHVPLFVKLPMGQFGGTTRREWVQHVDLMPTILRLSGVESPAGVQGHDVFDRSVSRDEVFAEESHEGNVLRSLRVRRGASELKLITANEGNPRGLETTELYRVDIDPRERVNLADELPWEREHVAGRLVGAGDRASAGRVEREDVALRGEDAARLRALGYAGGGEAEESPTPDRRN
jgi:uncharacterized protein (TIRG00374 family)